MRTVRIPLHSRKYPGLYALIDEADFDLVNQHRWTPHIRKRSQYAMTHISGKTVYLHRLIMSPKPGEIVDHINHDGLDCRRKNLRNCEPKQNSWNTAGRGKARSGFLGVWQRPTGMWASEVTILGRKYTAGTFDTAEDAAHARDRLAYHLRGEFAVLNFPEEANVVRLMTPEQRKCLVTSKARGRYRCTNPLRPEDV